MGLFLAPGIGMGKGMIEMIEILSVCVWEGGDYDGHSNKKKMFKLTLILFILEPPRAQSGAPKTLRPIPAVFQDEGTSVVGEYRAVYSTTQLCFWPVFFFF